jgi:hypothetical protein
MSWSKHLPLSAFLLACSSPVTMATAPPPSLAANAQTPPQSGPEVEAWLAQGSYKQWHCEAAVHTGRTPSPHGMNRICSNDATSSFKGAGERPVGSAGVKELYDDTGKTIVGYATYVKTSAASADGVNWYWYERVPLSSMAPHDKDGIVANGFGNAGPAKGICVGCHSAAGSDSAHVPRPGSSDEVYTQVN